MESEAVERASRTLREATLAMGRRFSAAADRASRLLPPQLISPASIPRTTANAVAGRLAATMPIEGTPLSLALTYLPEDAACLSARSALQPMASTTTRSGSCRKRLVSWVWSLRAGGGA